MGVGLSGKEPEGAAGSEYVKGAPREDDFPDWNVVRREFLELVKDLELGAAAQVVEFADRITDPSFHNPIIVQNASCASLMFRADQFGVKRFTVHRVESPEIAQSV
jgi:hypothetical protein